MLIRAKAPLRVSFAGGGTDVPPFPAEGRPRAQRHDQPLRLRHAAPAGRRQIRIESVDYGFRQTSAWTSRSVFDGKLDLAKAAIRRFAGARPRGFDLLLHSNAPPGSGLGSSSTMMVALIGLLKELRSAAPDRLRDRRAGLRDRAQRPRHRGGLQDQYAATFGGFNFIEFDGDRVIVNPLRIAPDVILELEHNLLLCYTGMTRQGDHIIEDQTARFEGATRTRSRACARRRSWPSR